MAALIRRPLTWLLVALVLTIAAFMFLIAPNYKVYLIHTGSMTPTIPIGSAVLVHKGPVHVGDVITFHRFGDRALVTHRLIKINPDGSYTTKGDGNATPDIDSTAPHNVVGHVVAAPQHVGTVVEFLFHSTAGYALDVLLLLMMFVALMNTPKSGAHRAPGRRKKRAPAEVARPAWEMADTVVVLSAEDVSELHRMLDVSLDQVGGGSSQFPHRA